MLTLHVVLHLVSVMSIDSATIFTFHFELFLDCLHCLVSLRLSLNGSTAKLCRVQFTHVLSALFLFSLFSLHFTVGFGVQV